MNMLMMKIDLLSAEINKWKVAQRMKTQMESNLNPDLQYFTQVQWSSNSQRHKEKIFVHKWRKKNRAKMKVAKISAKLVCFQRIILITVVFRDIPVIPIKKFRNFWMKWIKILPIKSPVNLNPVAKSSGSDIDLIKFYDLNNTMDHYSNLKIISTHSIELFQVDLGSFIPF